MRDGPSFGEGGKGAARTVSHLIIVQAMLGLPYLRHRICFCATRHVCGIRVAALRGSIAAEAVLLACHVMYIACGQKFHACAAQVIFPWDAAGFERPTSALRNEVYPQGFVGLCRGNRAPAPADRLQSERECTQLKVIQPPPVADRSEGFPLSAPKFGSRLAPNWPPN